MTLLQQAARDNAEWCEAVARSHGIRSRFTADAWLAASRPPALYPDAVTLGASANCDFLRELDLSDGCSVKDSYACLDLRGEGFEVVRDARWIVLSPSTAAGTGAAEAVAGPAGHELEWASVEPTDLAQWSALQANAGAFRRSLLAEPGVVLLRADAGGELAAGAVLSHTGAVVGVSNVVTAAGTSNAAVWHGIAAEVARRFPGLTAVGYESGADLMAPLGAGFTEFADLRIWAR